MRKSRSKKALPWCEEACSLLNALSHPGRLRILGHLLEGPKTVTELQPLCGLSQSQLSQFLTRMRTEGLVVCMRRGRFQYYSPAHLQVVQLYRAVHQIFRAP